MLRHGADIGYGPRGPIDNFSLVTGSGPVSQPGRRGELIGVCRRVRDNDRRPPRLKTN